MGASAGDIVLEWVFPILGGIIGAIMFASPLNAVRKVRRDRSLGDLNPLPYPLVTANCASWIGYTYVVQERNTGIFIFWANQIGIILGLFYTFSCYTYATTKTRDRQLAVILICTFIQTTLGAITSMSDMGPDAIQTAWGIAAVIHTCIYYAAPLSTIVLVLKTRNTATLHWPLNLMNATNGLLWTCYGVAVADPYVYGPNAVGAVIGGFVLILKCILPNKNSNKQSLNPAQVPLELPSKVSETMVAGIPSV